MGLATADESVFWYYITERFHIHERRAAGLPKPWTEDKILQQYKFTNIFREWDRGTTWLRENFIKPYWDDDPSLLAFNISFYRMFNWWGTGAYLGWQTEWNVNRIVALLEARLAAGKQVFTGAHIVYSRPGFSKVKAITEVCHDLFELREEIVDTARKTRSMEKVYDKLKTVDSIGGFLAHEIVQDLRHSPLLEDATDVNTWTNLGPGAKRGLQRLQLPANNQAQGQKSMVELYKRSLDNLPTEITQHPTKWELHSVEFSLCEIDKYIRVKSGEGRPRSMYSGAR